MYGSDTDINKFNQYRVFPITNLIIGATLVCVCACARACECGGEQVRVCAHICGCMCVIILCVDGKFLQIQSHNYANDGSISEEPATMY